jgi:uncharacterized protein YmfQ (DUF2313 family)
MARTAQDYAEVFARLMPLGRLWRFLPGSAQAQVLLALSRVMARADGVVDGLLDAPLPGDFADLLPEWEATLGLGDSIGGLSTAQRAAQVRARFITGNGPSLAFITSYAAQLGFTIQITRYAPARADVLTAGAPVYSEEWCSVIGITVLANANGTAPADLIAALQAFSAHILFILNS